MTGKSPVLSSDFLNKNYQSQLDGWSEDQSNGQQPITATASNPAAKKQTGFEVAPGSENKANSGKDKEKEKQQQKDEAEGADNNKDQADKDKAQGKAKKEKGPKGGTMKPPTAGTPAKDVTATATEGKSKGELRRERAKLQEAQRAAKAAARGETPAAGAGASSSSSASASASAASASAPSGGKKSGASEKKSGPMLQFDDPKKAAKHAKQAVLERTHVQKQVPLFSHLPQYERESSFSLKVGFGHEEIHPAILRLGLQYASGIITGSNARCVGMLEAFKQFIKDYQTPPSKVLSRDLHSKVNTMIRFLIDCRPQSLSMGNAIRYLKMHISKLPPTLPEEKAKEVLLDHIDAFLNERIVLADQVIADAAASKIANGDIILTYGMSQSVEMALKKAHKDGKQFRVIVVDSRPKLEGKVLLRALVNEGIKCSYILLNAVGYVMKEVSKVLIGAYAMLANGTCVSRVGTAMVGMMAHTYKVPFLVCCETYKFHERVQVDSICFNELGDPDDLIAIDRDDSRYGDVLADWRDLPKLKLLNLVYDLTPVEFVNMVITEVGMIPATSVPVILREYHKDHLGVDLD